jgi:hypothetical protein
MGSTLDNDPLVSKLIELVGEVSHTSPPAAWAEIAPIDAIGKTERPVRFRSSSAADQVFVQLDGLPSVSEERLAAFKAMQSRIQRLNEIYTVPSIECEVSPLLPAIEGKDASA